MSRLLFDNDSRSRLRSVPEVSAEDPTTDGRSADTSFTADAGAARVRRRREDPRGRRSLTGREFRRPRSL